MALIRAISSSSSAFRSSLDLLAVGLVVVDVLASAAAAGGGMAWDVVMFAIGALLLPREGSMFSASLVLVVPGSWVFACEKERLRGFKAELGGTGDEGDGS